MTRLRHRDVSVFSEALKILYADTRAETLARRSLGTLRGLFACEFASFSLLDVRRSHWHFAQLEPEVPEWPGMDVYRRYLHEDPAAVHIMRTRTREAVKMSDFCSLREFRSSRLYAEVFRQVRCDRRLGFAVQNAKPVALAATLNRRGRDFSEEERTLLNLLLGHLLQANALAQTQRLARTIHLETQDRGRETFGVGLIELDARGRVQWLTERAEVLLRDYFTHAARRVSTRRLPDDLERQVRQRTTAEAALALVAPMSIWYHPRPDGRKLKVRLGVDETGVGRQLLLEEEVDTGTAASNLSLVLGLTKREGEVLHLLAEGMTNREISQAMGNQEATVSKHLERVFYKLQVSNRAAAVRVVTEARATR